MCRIFFESTVPNRIENSNQLDYLWVCFFISYFSFVCQSVSEIWSCLGSSLFHPPKKKRICLSQGSANQRIVCSQCGSSLERGQKNVSGKPKSFCLTSIHIFFKCSYLYLQNQQIKVFRLHRQKAYFFWHKTNKIK